MFLFSFFCGIFYCGIKKNRELRKITFQRTKAFGCDCKVAIALNVSKPTANVPNYKSKEIGRVFVFFYFLTEPWWSVSISRFKQLKRLCGSLMVRRKLQYNSKQEQLTLLVWFLDVWSLMSYTWNKESSSRCSRGVPWWQLFNFVFILWLHTKPKLGVTNTLHTLLTSPLNLYEAHFKAREDRQLSEHNSV